MHRSRYPNYTETPSSVLFYVGISTPSHQKFQWDRFLCWPKAFFIHLRPADRPNSAACLGHNAFSWPFYMLAIDHFLARKPLPIHRWLWLELAFLSASCNSCFANKICSLCCPYGCQSWFFRGLTWLSEVGVVRVLSSVQFTFQEQWQCFWGWCGLFWFLAGNLWAIGCGRFRPTWHQSSRKRGPKHPLTFKRSQLSLSKGFFFTCSLPTVRFHRFIIFPFFLTSHEVLHQDHKPLPGNIQPLRACQSLFYHHTLHNSLKPGSLLLDTAPSQHRFHNI